MKCSATMAAAFAPAASVAASASAIENPYVPPPAARSNEPINTFPPVDAASAAALTPAAGGMRAMQGQKVIGRTQDGRPIYELRHAPVRPETQLSAPANKESFKLSGSHSYPSYPSVDWK